MKNLRKILPLIREWLKSEQNRKKLVLIALPVLLFFVVIFLIIFRYQQPKEPKGLQGVEVAKRLDVTSIVKNFQNPDLTCGEEEVFVSYKSLEDGIFYLLEYNLDLDQRFGPYDLQKDIEKRNEADNFTDHALVLYKGGSYAAFSVEREGEGLVGLYIAKYDRDIDAINLNYVLKGEDAEGYEDFERPLIRVYDDLVYVINSRHDEMVDDDNNRNGVVVRVYDKRLNFKERFELVWNDLQPPGTADLVLYDGGYGVIQTDGVKKPKLSIFYFDKDKNYTGKKQLISNWVINTYQIARPRAIFSDGRYYIALSSMSSQEENAPISLFTGVFDEAFNFQKLLKLTEYSSEEYEKAFKKASEYICKVGDTIYATIETDMDISSPGSDELMIMKYKLTDGNAEQEE